jgi:hypothetical protein
MYVCMYVYRYNNNNNKMGTKQIYLKDELIHKLKDVDNVSGLISQLLENHFRQKVRPDVKVIEQELVEIKERSKVLEDTRTKVIVEKQIEQLTEQQKREKDQQRYVQKWENVRKNAGAFFSEFELLEKHEQDKLIDEYLNNNPNLNLVQWLINKGFKDNIKDE